MSSPGLRERLVALRERLRAHPDDGHILDEMAVLFHQAGQTPAAVECATRAAAALPGDPLVHDHLGLILLAAARPHEAVAAARRATALAPRRGEFHLNLGNALLAAGDVPTAVAALERAVALLPREPLAWFNCGNALARAGRPADAITRLERALALEPAFAAARRNLALLHHATGDTPRALALLTPAATDDSAALLATLGTIHLERDDPAAALAPLERAAQLAPDDPGSQLQLARCLRRLGRNVEAAAVCEAGLRHAPNDPDLWNQLGLASAESAGAENAFRRALALRAEHLDAAINLSRLLVLAERAGEALAVLAPFLRTATDSVALLCAHAFVLAGHGSVGEALALLRRAVVLDPGHAHARWLLATAELAAGDPSAGWTGYEWRWQTDTRGERRFVALPSWPDAAPRHGHLLVWGEQGVGDEVMFASLVPALAARVDRLTLACTPRFIPLFARSFPQVAVVAEPDSPHAPHPAIDADWQLAAGSIPARFCEHAGAGWPHRGRATLVADPVRVSALRDRYRTDARPLVGLAWRTGNARNGHARSIPPPIWTEALRDLPFRFVSLQYGDCTADLATAAAAGLELLVDPTVDTWNDLDGFAAQIAALDAVLTIDNSTVHFAGALGRPTWLLVPTPADWRWRASGTTTPWYDSVRIHRRPPGGGWTPVIAAAAAELQTFLATAAHSS
ncbi:MAG: tetratricopeptide repeat protein [Opitutaceae bacterium]